MVTTLFPNCSTDEDWDHSLVAQSVVSCSTVSNDIVEALSATHPKPRDMLARRNSAFSAILGPDGAQPYGFASTT
jgi:hypothetical protein